MPTGDQGQNHLFVDEVLRRAGVDLWGAGGQRARRPHAPGLPAAVSLIARIDAHALARLEHGDATAYRTEYRRLNGLLDEAVAALVAALRQRGHEAVGAAATIYSELPDSGDWLAAGVFAHKTAATRAGLGWIGKTGLFVSPEAGPKARLATVFTDLPLDLGTPVTEGRCGSCRALPRRLSGGRRTRRRLAGRHGARPAVRRRRLLRLHGHARARGRPHLRPLRRRLPVRPAARHLGARRHPTTRRPP